MDPCPTTPQDLSDLKVRIGKLEGEIAEKELEHDVIINQVEEFKILSQNDPGSIRYKKDVATLLDSLLPLVTQYSDLLEANAKLTERLEKAKLGPLSLNQKDLTEKIADKEEEINRLKERLAQLRDLDDF